MHPIEAYCSNTKTDPKAFAQAIGVTRRTVDYYIAGRIPEPDIIVRIKEATDGQITANDLHEARAKLLEERAQ